MRSARGEDMTRWCVAGLSVSRDRESRSWSRPGRHCGWQRLGVENGEEGMRGGEESGRGWWRWRSGGRQEARMQDPLSSCRSMGDGYKPG